jgi:hypothetical protein
VPNHPAMSDHSGVPDPGVAGHPTVPPATAARRSCG